MEKVIFVTQRVERIESYNEKRDALDQNIILLLLKCGYTPIPLPNNIDIMYVSPFPRTIQTAHYVHEKNIRC